MNNGYKTLDQKDILQWLNTDGGFNSEEFANACGYEHQKVVGVLRSLAGMEIVKLDPKSAEKLVLSEEAKKYITAGSPEVQVFKYEKRNVIKI